VASKQLEIIVNARDNASGVFRGVGDSADGLSSKLGSLDSLTSTAKGFKSSLRTVKTLAIAYETIPVAIDAVKAAYATLTGSAEEAASGQRTLLEGIKSFPIVGKIAGGAAEYLGDKVAHIFGKQTTAEIEADAAKAKAALEGFAVATKKIAEDLGRGKNEVALIGLAPDDAAVEKAKQQYAKAIQDLKPLKAALIASAGQISGEDAKAQADKIKQIADDAAKVRDDEIAKANGKKELAEHEFSGKLVDITRERNQQLEVLGQDLEMKQLNADNRAYEARLSGLKTALSKEIDAVQDAAHKQFEELEKQKAGLQPLAHAGNEEAKNQIAALNEAQTKIFENSQEQQGKLADSAIVEQKAARDAAIRDATLASLRAEADAGDAIAKVALDRLTTSREQEATEKALAAIAKDTDATDQQRADAARQILELKRAASIVTTQGLAASELSILEQQAALGSESARIKVEQLQTAKAQADAEAKINAILDDRNSTIRREPATRSVTPGCSSSSRKRHWATRLPKSSSGRSNSKNSTPRRKNTCWRFSIPKPAARTN
jgi:hypothetical protein